MKSLSTVLPRKSTYSSSKHYFLESANEQVIKNLPDSSVDLILTSPPYNIGKSYEVVTSLEEYLATQEKIISELPRILKSGGNVCWQVGFTMSKNELIPLDIALYPIFKKHGFKLRNRIIWTFGHGMHAQKRFSGRHETVLWFSREGEESYFELDAVRVPQKYPEKTHYRGPKKGQLSGHPLGKNPGDVWDIPNVKAHHVEKTEHECQFPIALAQRLIRSLSPRNGVVFDPYAGVGTTACAAVLEERYSISSELEPKYVAIALERIRLAFRNELQYRPLEKPIQQPIRN